MCVLWHVHDLNGFLFFCGVKKLHFVIIKRKEITVIEYNKIFRTGRIIFDGG